MAVATTMLYEPEMRSTCLWSAFLFCFSCSSNGKLNLDDNSTTDSGTQTDSATDTAPDTGNGLEPAGDYSQTGPWTPGHLEKTITGSTGSTLYIDAWFPSSESGSDHHYYGWST